MLLFTSRCARSSIYAPEREVRDGAARTIQREGVPVQIGHAARVAAFADGRSLLSFATMAQSPREGLDDDSAIKTESKKKTEKVRRWQVVLHNDDYTTMEFVVFILMKFFHKSETEATHIMLSVHHMGRGVAGVYTKDVAETKVKEVSDYAKERGMPLRLTAEPADE